MPKVAMEMSALAVKKLKHPGTTNNPIVKAVGGVAGLHIQVTNTGAKSWLLRTTINSKRRDMGLGPYPGVSLADARQNAADTKAKARQESTRSLSAKRQRVRHKRRPGAPCFSKMR
ncbi:hypothetical protein LP7551_00899 [Roseibium album]|nr:hypothetical protein LP7551_00899 [Roseibium album]